MFNLLQNSQYPTEMLYLLAEHTLIKYVQFTIGSKRKNLPPLREIVRERF